MRRFLTALAMIAASVFIAAPAIAQDDTTVPSDSGSSNQSTPEETPPSQDPPPAENLLENENENENEGEGEGEEPEPSVKKLADGEVGALAKDPNDEKKITICHRRAAQSNPYGPKAITVSVNSIIKESGHDGHEGPVWPLEGMDGKWGDIIPEFNYVDENDDPQTYPGKNVPEGQAFLDNNCQKPGEPADDDDGTVDGDDDGDDDKGDLPATGGGSPWILLTGGLLTVLGIAILSNGSMGLMQGSVAGRHIRL